MTDLERLEELQCEIHRLEAILKPMYEERKELNRKIKADNKDSLPYKPHVGMWFRGKDEELYLYYSYRADENGQHTYYTKPLYKANGNLIGYKTSRKTILEKLEELRTDGYVEVK